MDGRGQAPIKTEFSAGIAGALYLAVHFHALGLGGVLTCESPWADPVFHPLAPLLNPSVSGLEATSRRTACR